MARKSRCKKAKAAAKLASSDANAARLTLLGLPVEIRTMILRMVVGDQLIHMFKEHHFYYNWDGETSIYKGWSLVRSICIATSPDGISTTSATCSSPSSSASGTDLSFNFRYDHSSCAQDRFPKDRLDEDELDQDRVDKYRGDQDKGDPLNLRVFAANRQLHQEAFILFWRTSHFCFEDGDVVKRCLDRLTESQKTNLRNLALDVHFGCCSRRDGDFNQMYWQTWRDWPICDVKNAGSHPLRFLESLELRLQLGYDTTQNTSACQLGTIRAVFQALGKLRLLHLKQACLTVSTTDHYVHEIFKGQLFTTEELAEVTASFQVILLSSTVTKEDQAQFLTFDMQGLKKSLASEEAECKANIAAVDRLQKQADSNRAKADQLKEQLSNMEAALEKQDVAAMHSLLMG